MKPYLNRKIFDRALLAALILGGGLYANHVGPAAPEPPQVRPQSIIRCSSDGVRQGKKVPQDLFVPAAPNEPMESLEN